MILFMMIVDTILYATLTAFVELSARHRQKYGRSLPSLCRPSPRRVTAPSTVAGSSSAQAEEDSDVKAARIDAEERARNLSRAAVDCEPIELYSLRKVFRGKPAVSELKQPPNCYHDLP